MIRVPTPLSAVLFVAGVAVLFLFGGVALRMVLGEGGVMAAEWLLLFLPAALFVRAGGFDPRATLFLAPPARGQLSAAVLLVVGAAPMAWFIGWAQSFVLPVPPEMVEALRTLVTADSPARLVWLLLAVAVTPALCEEIVFRGVLLSSTQALPTWRAVLLNGVVFGAFHLSLDAPVRFLPTAWLGIVIAWAVLRTRSIWVGVVMHGVNNGAIVLLASVPAAQSVVTDPTSAPPAWLVVVSGLFLAVGAAALSHASDVFNPRREP